MTHNCLLSTILNCLYFRIVEVPSWAAEAKDPASQRRAVANLAREKMITEQEARENAGKIAQQAFQLKYLNKENEKFFFEKTLG